MVVIVRFILKVGQFVRGAKLRIIDDVNTSPTLVSFYSLKTFPNFDL